MAHRVGSTVLGPGRVYGGCALWPPVAVENSWRSCGSADGYRGLIPAWINPATLSGGRRLGHIGGRVQQPPIVVVGALVRPQYNESGCCGPTQLVPIQLPQALAGGP